MSDGSESTSMERTPASHIVEGHRDGVLDETRNPLSAACVDQPADPIDPSLVDVDCDLTCRHTNDPIDPRSEPSQISFHSGGLATSS